MEIPKYSMPSQACRGCQLQQGLRLCIFTAFAPPFVKYQLMVSYRLCKVEKAMRREIDGWFKRAQVL